MNMNFYMKLLHIHSIEIEFIIWLFYEKFPLGLAMLKYALVRTCHNKWVYAP